MTILTWVFFGIFHQLTTKVITSFNPQRDNGYTVYLNLENQNVKLDSGIGVADTGLVTQNFDKPVETLCNSA